MRKLTLILAASGLVIAPIQAAAAAYPGSDVRPGAFVGAQLKMSLGGRAESRPRAALAIAPTQSRVSPDGMVRTSIGEGLALNFASKSKPTLTVAGVRADNAFRLQRGGQAGADRKLGISTGGWVAIGVGVAVVLGGIYFVHLVHEADKNSD